MFCLLLVEVFVLMFVCFGLCFGVLLCFVVWLACFVDLILYVR